MKNLRKSVQSRSTLITVTLKMNSASFFFFFRTSINLFTFSLAPGRIDQWIQITTLQMLYGPRFHHTSFMNRPSTFCIASLLRPSNGRLVVNKRVPVLTGDEIFLLKPSNVIGDSSTPHLHHSPSLPWFIHETTRQLIINVSEHDLAGIDYAWAFEIRYKDKGLY